MIDLCRHFVEVKAKFDFFYLSDSVRQTHKEDFILERQLVKIRCIQKDMSANRRKGTEYCSKNCKQDGEEKAREVYHATSLHQFKFTIIEMCKVESVLFGKGENNPRKMKGVLGNLIG